MYFDTEVLKPKERFKRYNIVFMWKRYHLSHKARTLRPRTGGRAWRRAWLRCGRKKTTGGRLGRDGGLGRPGGRGPVGRGGKIGRLGKKKEWATAGPKAEENYFRIKFGFLNIQRLCKFAQGDLGGILT
jgi:hypothetical protein